MHSQSKKYQQTIELILQRSREQSRLSILFRELLAKTHGIHAADGECIDFLLEKGQATAGELAKYTNLTTGAVTGLIKRLKKAGVITVASDPKDKRKTVVKPVLSKLKPAMKLYGAYVNDLINEVYSQYSPKELETLADYHERMRDLYKKEIEKIKSSPE